MFHFLIDITSHWCHFLIDMTSHWFHFLIDMTSHWFHFLIDITSHWFHFLIDMTSLLFVTRKYLPNFLWLHQSSQVFMYFCLHFHPRYLMFILISPFPCMKRSGLARKNKCGHFWTRPIVKGLLLGLLTRAFSQCPPLWFGPRKDPAAKHVSFSSIPCLSCDPLGARTMQVWMNVASTSEQHSHS